MTAAPRTKRVVLGMPAQPVSPLFKPSPSAAIASRLPYKAAPSAPLAMQLEYYTRLVQRSHSVLKALLFFSLPSRDDPVSLLEPSYWDEAEQNRMMTPRRGYFYDEVLAWAYEYAAIAYWAYTQYKQVRDQYRLNGGPPPGVTGEVLARYFSVINGPASTIWIIQENLAAQAQALWDADLCAARLMVTPYDLIDETRTALIGFLSRAAQESFADGLAWVLHLTHLPCWPALAETKVVKDLQAKQKQLLRKEDPVAVTPVPDQIELVTKDGHPLF